jgi:hypothetical protein
MNIDENVHKACNDEEMTENLGLDCLPYEILEQILEYVEPKPPVLNVYHECIEDLCRFGMYTAYFGVEINIPEFNLDLEMKWSLFASLENDNCTMYVCNEKKLKTLLSIASDMDDMDDIIDIIELLEFEDDEGVCTHILMENLESIKSKDKDDWLFGTTSRFIGTNSESTEHFIGFFDEGGAFRFRICGINTSRVKKNMYNAFCNDLVENVECILEYFESSKVQWEKLMEDSDIDDIASDIDDT